MGKRRVMRYENSASGEDLPEKIYLVKQSMSGILYYNVIH